MKHSIEFKLFAPRNQAVALIGSFSDWESIPMEQSQQGYFQTLVDLDDGVYQYKFRVQSQDGSEEPHKWVEINDPYSTEIDVATSNSVLRIKDGQKIVDDYVWQYDHVPLPPDHELVIYELFISDFAGDSEQPEQSGQYHHTIAKLDYLKELGINAIELMPVNEAPGDYDWGYTPSYLLAPKLRFGTTNELKQLIDQCHARGIRVILDQLYNHSSDASPLLQIDRDYWYYHDRHHPDANPSDYWGPEFNYEYQDDRLGIRPAWKLMTDVVQFWIQNYHIDGIRYDALKELANDDFLHHVTGIAKQTADGKPFFNIGEHIPETPKIVSPNGPMDSCWHDSFYHFLVAHLTNQTFDLEQLKSVLEASRQEIPEGVTKVVNYLSNHDHNCLLAELGKYGIFGQAAFQRVKLGVAVLMTAPGVPLIWMGEEFGMCTDSRPNQPSKLDWSLLQQPLNRDLFEYYQRLIALRIQNSALQTSNIQFLHEDLSNQVFVYDRWHNAGARVVVVTNWSEQCLENYCVPHIPDNGMWCEWITKGQIASRERQLTINLMPYEAQILVWQSDLP
ncbi:alpha-amylase family glycosyl hydrolase [Pantanalinema sp. GBBB05]|uniref:alpha-amylase family glycosyl hydrolase n=1 Tax=Pantanalinema sp. GBBB05 TaxID=2604139 RepID=UPI001D3207DB|nr:alpha-amylase [Pantanalinema sp. GBBB05]